MKRRLEIRHEGQSLARTVVSTDEEGNIDGTFYSVTEHPPTWGPFDDCATVVELIGRYVTHAEEEGCRNYTITSEEME